MNLLFGFSGRIGRGGWWLGQLAVLAVLAVGTGMLFAIASTGQVGGDISSQFLSNANLSVLAVLGCVVVLISWINVATTVKRFHDRNKSGAWFCIVFIPWIGVVWQIVECGMLPGSPGMNDYGSSPGPGGGTGFADGIDFGSAYAAPEKMQAERTVTPRTAAPGTARIKPSGPVKFGRRV